MNRNMTGKACVFIFACLLICASGVPAADKAAQKTDLDLVLGPLPDKSSFDITNPALRQDVSSDMPEMTSEPEMTPEAQICDPLQAALDNACDELETQEAELVEACEAVDNLEDDVETARDALARKQRRLAEISRESAVIVARGAALRRRLRTARSRTERRAIIRALIVSGRQLKIFRIGLARGRRIARKLVVIIRRRQSLAADAQKRKERAENLVMEAETSKAAAQEALDECLG